MKKLYEDIKLIQKEALEKEIESWVTESLEKYEFYGEGEISQWTHDYVYGRSMNEALAAQVGLRAMTKHRKENRSFTKQELNPDDKKRLHVDHIRRQTHQKQIVDEETHTTHDSWEKHLKFLGASSFEGTKEKYRVGYFKNRKIAGEWYGPKDSHRQNFGITYPQNKVVSEGMRGRIMGVQGAFGKHKPTETHKLEPHREGPYAVGWRGQSWEWYGDGEPGKGPGRYKPKGDGGRFTHINIPTHAQAVEIAKKVDQDYHDKKFHEAEGVYRKHGDGHYVEYHGSVVTPHKEMSDYDKDNLSHQQKGHERWRAKDMSEKPAKTFKSLKESVEMMGYHTMRAHGWTPTAHKESDPSVSRVMRTVRPTAWVHKTKGGLFKTSKGWVHDMTPASGGGATEQTAHAGSTDTEMVKYVKGLGK